MISKTVGSELAEARARYRIQGPNPVENAIAFARYRGAATSAGAWWCRATTSRVASTSRPLDAAASAALATQGVFAPLLLTDRAGALPAAARGLPAERAARVRGRPRPGGLQPRLDPRRRRAGLVSRPGAAGPDHGADPGPGERATDAAPGRRITSARERVRAAGARSTREPTVEDVRQLMGASTPHFALQLRNRIRTLIPGCRRTTPRASRASARSRGWTRWRSGAERRGAKAAASRHARACARRRAGDAPASARCRCSRPEERERADAPGGYLDLLGRGAGVDRRGAGPDAHRLVPRIYERWWRPRARRAFKGVFGPGMGTSTGSRACCWACRPATACSTWRAAPGTSPVTSPGRWAPEGLAVGIDVSVTMLAQGRRRHARGGSRRRRAHAAPSRRLPWWTCRDRARRG